MYNTNVCLRDQRPTSMASPQGNQQTSSLTLWWFVTYLLNVTIEIVRFPSQHDDFPCWYMVMQKFTREYPCRSFLGCWTACFDAYTHLSTADITVGLDPFNSHGSWVCSTLSISFLSFENAQKWINMWTYVYIHIHTDNTTIYIYI